MTDEKTESRKNTPGGMVLAFALVCAALAGGCSGDYSANKEKVNRLEDLAGPPDKREPQHRVFGNIGLGARATTSEGLVDFGILGPTEPGQGESALPVNKYLWQAALDVLSFMPLISTDPFTGVIATDWGSVRNSPNERFKVTAYMVDPSLSAASLKVAVFREELNANGNWIQAPVNPETALQIEDAILTRARQIRVASQEQENTG